MNSKSPLISIIVPVYNKANYIFDCINSLLNQSYQNIEILIYDDFSKDNSLKILDSFNDKRIKIYRGNVNKGVRFGRDFLLGKANGDYISFFDADDICHENKFVKILNYFIKNPNIQIIGSRVKYINSRGKTLFKPFTFETFSIEDIKANLFFCNTISTSTVVFKKEVCKSIDFQSFNYVIGEDYFIWIKLSENYNIINLPNKLVTYRVTDTGMMGNTKSSYPEAIKFIHSYQFENFNITPHKTYLDIHNRFMYDENFSKFYLLKSLIFYNYLLTISNPKYNKKSFLKQVRINWLRKCIVFSKQEPLKSIYIYLFYFKQHNFTSILNIYILSIFSLKYTINKIIYDKE